MYLVTVLTPGGRRQQVKVTPNTTLLQVLEEVCTKHGLNAQEYDLRHHNKILDVSSIFRFTGLPNNAQLEMTEALKQRQESPVTLGLQFESGERVTGIFRPSESIWNIILSLKPEEEYSENLVVIYMRQEISGREKLQKTTLRSLGLTSGSAVLRLLQRSPDKLHVQASVSATLPPRVLVAETPEGKKKKDPSKSPESPKKEIHVEKSRTPSPEKKTSSPEPTVKDLKYKTDGLRGNFFENWFRDEKSKRAVSDDSKNMCGSTGASSRNGESSCEDFKGKFLPESKIKSEYSVKKKMSVIEEESKEASVILLGDRNAVAFNLNNVKPVKFEEEPDDFYDLTIHDAKLLYKQAKQLCAELENAPLMTSAQRELEKDKKILSLLHQYKKTVLRVKFPDRTVLQGTFAPLETVSAVEKFVSDYLESPKLKFYLYTTPPKVILKSDSRLIECGCVPSCVLYFGLPPNVKPPSQYLKPDVLRQLSTPSAAALHAYQTRGECNKLDGTESEDTISDTENYSKCFLNSEPGPSGSQQWRNTPRDNENSPQFKIPKWFKSNK